MRIEIDNKAKEIINAYKNLNIRGNTVTTPYFRNVKRVRAELRSLVGKGTPEEIVEETIIFAQLRGFPLAKSTPEQIREFMQSQGIGVDCSGFVAHVYDHWLKSKKKGGIGRRIKYDPSNLYRRFIRALRPIENIGANLITCPLNAAKVNFNEALPGYLIRLKGIEHGHHVAIITAVETNDKGTIKSIEYTHSSPHFGEKNGVKTGLIEIVDGNKPLEKQNWTEKDDDGKSPTLLEYTNQVEDNGIVKPKFFELLK